MGEFWSCSAWVGEIYSFMGDHYKSQCGKFFSISLKLVFKHLGVCIRYCKVICKNCVHCLGAPAIVWPRVSHRCREHGGSLQNLMGGGRLKSIHGGSMGGLKIQSKNICEKVCLIVKLPAIILQACKFTKNELFHTHFSRILAKF